MDRYPFATLAVGEYFTRPRNMGKTPDAHCRRYRSIQQAAKQHSAKYGGKFAVTLINDGMVSCVRVE